MTDRPPFILCFAADSQGCGFHRIMTPLASLVHTGVANGRIDVNLWDDELILACQPDVIVWQRQVEDAQIEVMQRWRDKLPNTLFIYELDDYLDEIPPASFHASFMPPDIRSRIARALPLCDRVTTTTEPLAAWLASLSSTPVHVVPNALPAVRLKDRKARVHGKLRIGFAGGMSHTGDLELIRPAMREIGDAVQWVFFGTQPEHPPVDVEFHQGLPPTMYLDKLASLDFDLMLAPLEDNKFNECKSNLRLVETTVAGACVIAQDLIPYRTNKPPVFSYATTPESWTEAIQHFVYTANVRDRQNNADMLRAWVGRHYTLERVLNDRISAWLPTTKETRWVPVASGGSAKTLLACTDAADPRVRMPFLSKLSGNLTGLEEACREALRIDANVLWMRPGSNMTQNGLRTLQSIMEKTEKCASVVPLASDGANSFPQKNQWVPLPQSIVDVVDDIAKMFFSDVTLPITSGSGPVVLLNVSALKMLGIPDVKGSDGNEEQAIWEWGLLAAARDWDHVQAGGAYASSTVAPEQPSRQSLIRPQARGFGDLMKAEPERILTADARQKLETELLRRQWGGPRPGAMGFDNSYESWRLLRQVQDTALLSKYSDVEQQTVQRNMGWAADWTEKNKWIVFTDDSVTLQNNAIQWFDFAASQVSDDVMVIYADHESIIGDQRMPEFKPDFDQTLLIAQDYITPVCAIRAAFLTAAPVTKTDMFSIILDVFKQGGRTAFYHIQRILGSVKIDNVPETLALETLERKLLLESFFGKNLTLTAHPQLLGCLSAKWDTDIDHLVSIIIPTLGSARLLGPCINTILQHTNYPNYEIIIMQNGSRRSPELAPEVLARPNIKVVYSNYPVFNWAAINNDAIKYYAKGDYIVTMNDDVCVASKNWLNSMMAHAVQKDVGAVGAKLIHPAGMIQHVGVVCHKGIAGHMHKGMANGSPGYLGRALLSHEAIAVTGACMLFSREHYETVGEFNEDFAMNYNDTIFCLDLHRAGFRNVVEMSAELLHPEASTRPPSNLAEGMGILVENNVRLAKLYPDPDPFWNSNLQIVSTHNGTMLQGLNADMLAWQDFVPPPDAQRVLLINDLPGAAGKVIDIATNGDVPFVADLSGFKLKLVAPVPMNMTPWDIRNVKNIAIGLKSLGINKIILRSMVGAEEPAPPIETLRTLGALRPDINLIVDAVEPAVMTPWLVDSQDIDADVFGYVDMDTWKTTYENVVG